MTTHTAPTDRNATTAALAPRTFGRFELISPLGRSANSMSWLARDTRSSAEVMLCMPRSRPEDTTDLALRIRDLQRAARLDHPNVAKVQETSVLEGWPFIVVDRTVGMTLAEWLSDRPSVQATDSVDWMSAVLTALAYAHEAGVTHRDVQIHHVLIDTTGRVSVMGFAVSPSPSRMAPSTRSGVLSPPTLINAGDLAQRDVLAVGVILHRLLSGKAALGEDDVSRVVDRLPPLGNQVVQLPWQANQPVADGLRAIANRSTASLGQQRYLSARTLLHALNGWREANGSADAGPVATVLDRMRTVGHLPGWPGVGARVNKLLLPSSQRIDEVADEVLQDLGLTIELLRRVNSVAYQGDLASKLGTVITLRRCIALLGVNGVRQAATALRPWPGSLDANAAQALQREVDNARLAGFLAKVLRPAGYDAELVYLVAILQNAGRLLLRYHCADEAAQIRTLMAYQRVEASESVVASVQPGMPEVEAAFAVSGLDLEALGTAAIRQWGLGDEMVYMARRLQQDRNVRAPEQDSDVIRVVASAANEAVDVHVLVPSKLQAAALTRICRRYGGALEIDPRILRDALTDARSAVASGIPVLSAVPEGGRSSIAQDSPVLKSATDRASGPAPH